MAVVLSFYLHTLNTLPFLSSHVERTAKFIPVLAVELHLARYITNY